MKITTTKVTKISLDTEHYEALELIDGLLEKIQMELGEEGDLISCTTAEVLELNQISRIRGFLSGLFENDSELWENA